MESEIKFGSRVYHVAWDCHGTVTRRDGQWIFVQWDNCSVEDELHVASVCLSDTPEPVGNRTFLELVR